MQTLEVTDEQHAFIQCLREAIAENVVGKYGFVRERDAIQFLIDNLDDEFEIDVDVESTATADVANAVSAAIGDERDRDGVESVSYDESTDSVEEPAVDETDDSATPTVDTDDTDEPAASPTDTDETEPETSSNADDDEMLDEMMSLLDTYEDKWEESSSSDYRYTVTLPDGSTTDVQTKDDVRALLFKNYR